MQAVIIKPENISNFQNDEASQINVERLEIMIVGIATGSQRVCLASVP